MDAGEGNAEPRAGGEGSPDPPEHGYIVHPVERTRGGGVELDYIGRLAGGDTFVVMVTGVSPFFSVREEDVGRAGEVSEREGVSVKARPWPRRTMDGGATVKLETRSATDARRLRDALHREGVRTYEADVKLSAQHLMDLRIHGSVEIRGRWRPGRRVSRIYENPELSPAAFKPKLSVLSLDIETDAKARTVYAVALAFRDPYSSPDAGAHAAGSATHAGEGLFTEVLLNGGGASGASCFSSEKDMLVELRRRILDLDPDVITGWNVVDFDFRVLSERFSALGIPFDIGRSDTPARFLDREGTGEGGIRWKRSRAIVDGRQVLDAMWLTRLSGLTMEDYRLETVAQALLGRGKKIERLPEESGTEAIERLHRSDPTALTVYCMEDARLALEILDKEGLIELAVAKGLLLGTPLDQTWASVASFELLYMEHLHARGCVAPTLGIDQAPLERSPGGGIITPRAGLYEGVLVFDFKSLYPSIMRTFNIDPFTHVPRPSAKERESYITAPNGESFKREPGIIPQILEGFFDSRERAKREGNRAASFAYKIVMNSFYGVLGTDGCRFASSAVAGAITTFGQHILYWTRDRVRAKGYEVIYGDTDSLFVISGLARGSVPGKCEALGAELCAALNVELAAYVREAYGVESRLELEFEGHYSRFFLPPMRTIGAGGAGETSGDDEEPGSRGRAKGYAGLRVTSGAESVTERLEVVGMEAVRHDWTPLAQELQRELLEMVFHGAMAVEIEERVRGVLRELRAGGKDGKLAYRKSLRKPVEAYTKSSPPHARAAALLPPEERIGLIRYVWTVNGPQPESRRTAPPDYEHYVQKQVRPIVESLAPHIGLSTENLFAPGGQLGLF